MKEKFTLCFSSSFIPVREKAFFVAEEIVNFFSPSSSLSSLNEMREFFNSLYDEVCSSKLFAFILLSYDSGEEIHGVKGEERIKVFEQPFFITVLFRRLKKMNFFESVDEKKAFISRLDPLISDEEFVEIVNLAVEEEKGGEFYVINLSRPYLFKFEGEPLTLFSNLVRRHYSPYSFYLDAGEISFLSNSPELFLKKNGEKLISSPMKGTRLVELKREEEISLELGNDEKEKSENLMVIDMVRNDFGQIARFGSVRVEEIWRVERFSSVFQMFSSISAQLRDCVSFFQIIESIFPPASVTGAPKKRVMDEIARLEKFRRGFYCGSALLLKPDGNFTASVIIRTGFLNKLKRTGVWHAGAGITVESKPEREVEELKWKMKQLEYFMK